MSGHEMGDMNSHGQRGHVIIIIIIVVIIIFVYFK